MTCLHWFIGLLATIKLNLPLARVIILIPVVLLFDEEPVPARLPSPMLPPFLAALPLGPGLDSTSWHSSRARGRYTVPDVQSSRIILPQCSVSSAHLFMSMIDENLKSPLEWNYPSFGAVTSSSKGSSQKTEEGAKHLLSSSLSFFSLDCQRKD